jgi:hypothetical protein
MDELFKQQNLERYRDLVDTRTSKAQRGVILQLLADEMDDVHRTIPRVQ